MNLIFLIYFSFSAPGTPTSTLASVGEVYSKASSLQMSIEKTDQNEVLGTNKVSSGILQQKKDRVHVLLESPAQGYQEATTIIVDQENLWMIKPPPPQFKSAKTQVITAKRKGQGWNQQLLLRLLSNKELSQDFVVNKEEPMRENAIQLSLSLKAEPSSISEIKLLVDKSSFWIRQLSFKDENENRTTIKVKSTKFNVPVDDKLFDYKPPKDAQVTTY